MDVIPMTLLQFRVVSPNAGPLSHKYNKYETQNDLRNYAKFLSTGAKFVPLALKNSEAESTAPVENGPPAIELEFIGPRLGPDGAPEVQRASAISGEKLLRNIMLDNKVELYGPYGKVMNCGGGGSCGTCLVQIVEGEHLLNEQTAAEKRYLKKKPATWRLACQTVVGNKENGGKDDQEMIIGDQTCNGFLRKRWMEEAAVSMEIFHGIRYFEVDLRIENP